MAKQDRKDFYDQLILRLKEVESFPLLYMFKFIVPANNQKIAQINQLFSEEAEITMRTSQKGNYNSLTIRIVMTSAEEIIQIYQKAEEIEGLVAL